MQTLQEILDQGYTNVALDKQVTETFSKQVEEHLATLGFRSLAHINLSQNATDKSRWHVYILDTCTPYSYFPEIDKLLHNAELDTITHEERYTILWDKISDLAVTKDGTVQAVLYLLSADSVIYELVRNYVFDDGLDFELLWNNAFLDSFDYLHYVFVQVAESLWMNSLECAILPKDIAEMGKEKITQIYYAMLCASGEDMSTVDDFFPAKTDKEVV